MVIDRLEEDLSIHINNVSDSLKEEIQIASNTVQQAATADIEVLSSRVESADEAFKQELNDTRTQMKRSNQAWRDRINSFESQIRQLD